MSPFVILLRQLVRVTVLSQFRRSREQQRDKNAKYIKQYCLVMLTDVFIIDETKWILVHKIEPELSQMSNDELRKIASLIKKNTKRAQKQKPIKKQYIDDAALKRYHLEYQYFLAEEREKLENIRIQQRNSEKAHMKNIQFQNARKAYILENGESEADIVKRFF